MVDLIMLGIVGVTLRRAVEGYRSPRRFARIDDFANARSVLDCSSPLELWPRASFVHES